jgi:hypothetical protein
MTLAHLIAELDQLPRLEQQVVLKALHHATQPPSEIALEERAELEALPFLSDDALRTIAAEQMPSAIQERMAWLMDQNTQGRLSQLEQQELSAYVERGNRLLLRKAKAASLLVQRGQLFSPG